MRTADGYIIRKCLDGNSAAFGFLVDKYKESVYALAYSMLHNFHDAEDVTQEVFIKAYKKLHTLKQYDRFHAWLFAITSNFCRNLIRNRSKRPDREFIEDQESEILEESSLDSYREQLALDSAGNVYVVDQANLCIQKFDPEGNFLTKWGKGGSGNGQFAWPYGIAVDKEGNVYVADPNINQRIHKFDSDGKLLDSWGGMGQATGKFGGCVGVAINSDGDIHVVERGNNRVQVFDSDGRFQMTWGTEGDGNGQLSWPEGIAIDASDNVYVADTGNSRIQVFDFNGKFLTRWGSQGTEDGQFDFPNGIAVDNSGRVYVVDSSNNRIQVFDSKGNFLAKWGKYGAGDMEFSYPSYGIAVSQSGDVYVSDTFNNRIKVFRSPVGGSVDPANKQPVSWGKVKQTELYQNFPNPFNPETWIPYHLAQEKNVTISIYSVSGQIVRTLALGRKLAGSYISKEKAAHWDGRDDSGEQVASGVYFFSIQAGDFAATKKMVVKR